jgi:hypothetical protein
MQKLDKLILFKKKTVPSTVINQLCYKVESLYCQTMQNILPLQSNSQNKFPTIDPKQPWHPQKFAA